MIKNFLFIYSIFSATFLGIKALPIAEDHIWSTFFDINELNVDGFDDVRLNLAEGNNPFQDDEMTLEIVKLITAEKLFVTIKRSEILADKSTPIWYGQNTYTGFGDISYEKSTINEVPEKFPDFAMFQNYKEKVALVAFGNETHWIWEGFIGNSVFQHVFGNLYVLLDVTFPSPENFIEKIKENNYSTANELPMDLNTEKMQIIPEILVALDWKSVANKTARDVIKEVIVYYNAVDMLFSQFTSPSIQLNIAGIVIPKDSKSSPYFEKKSCKIEEEYYSNECLSFSPILDNLIRHFRKYNDIFFTKDYDIIMGMTNLPLCDVNGVCTYYGTSFESGTCEYVDDDHYAPITGAVRHPHFRGNYFLAAREIGHILGSKYLAKWVHVCYGGIMSEIDDYQDLHQWRLNWSTCAVFDISTHIRERENYTKCMWNLPKIFDNLQVSSTTTEMITAETTVEAITTVSGDTTTSITFTGTVNDKKYSTSTETTTIDKTAATNATTTTGTTSTHSTPVNLTTEMTSTTTPPVTMTTVEAPILTEEKNLTTKKPHTFKKVHLNDPVTVIVVKRNTDRDNNVILKRPKTLKTILGDVVDKIYYFVNGIIRRDIDH